MSWYKQSTWRLDEKFVEELGNIVESFPRVSRDGNNKIIKKSCLSIRASIKHFM